MAGDQLACPTCEKPIQVPGAQAQAPQERPTHRGSLFGRIVAGVIGGLIIGLLAVNIFILVFADPMEEEPGSVVMALSGILFFGLLIGSVVLGVKSMRPSMAWRRLLIPSGVLSLVLPLAALVMIGRMVAATAAKGGQMAELEAGAYAIGGTLLAVVAGFFGIILGAIFLTVGLLVGKKPKT